MKRFFISTILMVMSVFCFAANASAHNYKGTLSNVTMNGKHFNDVPNQIFVLDTYAGWQTIPTFPASVTFDGSF